MAAVQFHCPHCRGMFQVDSALAGVQVNCPHCQQVATLPDVLHSSGLPPPPPPGAGMFPPDPPDGFGSPPEPATNPFEFYSPASPPQPTFGSSLPFGVSPSQFDFLSADAPSPAWTPLGAPHSFASDPHPPLPIPGNLPPTTSATSKFGCPLCQGLFQVSASMSGQQVTCPHCRSVVTLPALGPAAGGTPFPPTPVRPSAPVPAPGRPTAAAGVPASPPPSLFVPPPASLGQYVPPSPAAPAAASLASLYPPGFGPAGTVTKAPAPVPSAPSPITTVKQISSSTGGSPMYPPGFGEASGSKELAAPSARNYIATEEAPPEKLPAPSNAPATAAKGNFYPPGFVLPGGAAAPASPVIPTKVPLPASPAPSPAKPVPSSPPPATDLGMAATSMEQTGVKAAEDVASLLPPEAAGGMAVSGAAVPPTRLPMSGDMADQRRQSVDELLPPGVGAGATPSDNPADTAVNSRPADGTVMLPTLDGGYVVVHDSVKTVAFAGEQVELRKMTPEEKARKRMFRTLFMAAFGMIFLAAVAIVLMMML